LNGKVSPVASNATIGLIKTRGWGTGDLPAPHLTS
jgi:hypothetical protein